MTRRHLSAFIGASALIILILDSGHALQWTSEGLQLCIRTVIPALFPFFVVSAYLTGNLGSLRFLSPVGHWFGVENEGIPVLVCGFLGGYPVGAHSAVQRWKKGGMTQAQARRMLAFCSQAGPSFLFGMLSHCFTNPAASWLLWAIQFLSAWMVSRCFPVQNAPGQKTVPDETVTFIQAFQTAIRSISGVCGWVILFHVLLGFGRRWLFWLLPEPIQVLLSGLLELTNGCCRLSQIRNESLRFVICAVMLNFGGICVLMQTAQAAGQLGIGSYLKGKVMQTIFALLISLPVSGILPIWSLAPLGLFVIFTDKRRKISRFPEAVGV